MKTFKIFILLILFSLGLNAQGVAIKTKRFFWADSEVNFNQFYLKNVQCRFNRLYWNII